MANCETSCTQSFGPVADGTDIMNRTPSSVSVPTVIHHETSITTGPRRLAIHEEVLHGVVKRTSITTRRRSIIMIHYNQYPAVTCPESLSRDCPENLRMQALATCVTNTKLVRTDDKTRQKTQQKEFPCKANDQV